MAPRHRRREPTSSTCGRQGPPRGRRCWPASTSSATRRPWSGRACGSVTCPPMPATTTSAPLRCWPRCTTPASAGWCWRRRWSSTARVAMRAPTHGPQVPGPRAVEALDGGDFENHCPACSRPLGVGAGRRGRPARSTQQLRRQQARPGALHVVVGASGRCLSGGPALPQRLRPGHAAGHALLGRRGDVPLLARARGAAPGVRGRAARCATSCTSPMSPAPTSSPSGPSSTSRPAATRRTTSARGVRSPSSTSPARCRPVPIGSVEPQVTGGYRLGDVRHIVASPELARRELGFTAQITPDSGPARVRHRAAAGLSRSPARVEQVLQQQCRERAAGRAPTGASGRAAARATA